MYRRGWWVLNFLSCPIKSKKKISPTPGCHIFTTDRNKFLNLYKGSLKMCQIIFSFLIILVSRIFFLYSFLYRHIRIIIPGPGGHAFFSQIAINFKIHIYSHISNFCAKLFSNLARHFWQDDFRKFSIQLPWQLEFCTNSISFIILKKKNYLKHHSCEVLLQLV